ncbi:MAG: phage holin family protein [Solirubrobacterales bacterium]|nr:phage holin family protein [Solirubrobacterales bacterium]MBV9715091.1 phage holin family protein [Solirubrobacterales bacterium]
MPAERQQSENITAAVTEVSERMTVLVREEIELAKAEMTTKVATLARGAGAVAAGAVFGVFGVVFGLLTLAWGLNSIFNSLWIGFAIVFVLLLLLAAVAFLMARRMLKVGPPTPNMAIDEAKLIRETVTTSKPQVRA